MFDIELAPWLRQLAAALEGPTHLALLGLVALGLWETGLCLGERARGAQWLLGRWGARELSALAQRRVDRAELLARLGPMAGLMGTLIPLGPGLAALGRGDLAGLAQSVTVAFDTTVLGLAVGALGFVLHRFRRRWYEAVLDRAEAAEASSSGEAGARVPRGEAAAVGPAAPGGG